MARLPRISGHDWNLLTGTVTGALALLLIPTAFFGKQITHSPSEWGLFVGVAFGVALFSSVIGNVFWNRASRLLPLTLVGSMILFETIFALLYAFIRESRGPGVYETVAMILIGGSVLISVRAHRHPPVMEEETMHP
ncbi:MAG: hypothetical protein EOP86_25995 [Verrucomicrobiaceae bacterium]|nr:MAG: hypothetical protein EOP86_25995 [Verrucomicrobiaceae bacterium]